LIKEEDPSAVGRNKQDIVVLLFKKGYRSVWTIANEMGETTGANCLHREGERERI